MFGTFTRMAGIAPLIDPAQKYDSAKFTWLGAITDAVSVCITWHTSPVKTWEDLREKSVTLGGTGPSGELDIFTNLYKNVLGAKIKLVSGYPGTAEIMLAMERGELDGVCGIDWTTIKAQRQRWIQEKQINIIAQTAFHKDPDLPNVPLIMDLTKDPEKLQILRLFVSAHDFARPFAAPPNIPEDRAAALIAAFDATTKDADFLAETAKHQMEVAPVSGKKLAAMLAEFSTTSEAILIKARAAIAR
jgi:tripartite-type tricarboxylate transporter receptor subunit TctC